MLFFYVWIYLDAFLLPHLKTENVRFPQKTSQICVIARPQRGRGNLKAEGMASRSEAREHVAKRNTYNKKHEIRRLFRPTIFRYGMTNRIVKDCRVGRKNAPSSQ